MPGVGKLEPFDTQTNWDEYRERAVQYFIANDVPDDKKRAVLLTCCGPATYTLLRNLLAPVKPCEASLTTIFDVLGRHFSPQPSEVVASFKFNSRTRQAGEAAADYFAALNKLADECGFGTFRERMLRDRIVAGINDESMQRRLLELPDLTLDMAKKTVIAMEAANKDSQVLSTAPAPFVAPTNAVSRDSTKPRREETAILCFRCGGGHLATQCRHLNSVCHNCGIKGHLSRVCKGRKNATNTRRAKDVANTRKAAPPSVNKSVHVVNDARCDEANERPDALQVYELWSLQGTAGVTQPYRVEVAVNGTSLLMEVDTGASVSVVSGDTFHRKFPSARLKPSTVVLKSYSGELSPVLGSLPVTVQLGNRKCEEVLYVVSGDCPSLMGRGWMKGLGLELGNARELNAVSSLEDVLAAYSTVFDGKLGTLKGVAAKITIQDNRADQRCVT
ncbi:uncharacterized protein LOC144095592 [Amblyomma americanum]